MEVLQPTQLRRSAIASWVLVSIALPLWLQHADGMSPQWLNHGGSITNDRHAVLEHKITTKTVSMLQKRWAFDAGFSVSATPAIADGYVYCPSWNGNLFAVNATTGSLVWLKNLSTLTGIPLALSRSTPSITRKLLLVGLRGPAMVIAVRRSDGKLMWKTLLDKHPEGIITMSGTPHEGAFYVGTSSLEETSNPLQCCTFQGSFHKLNVSNGRKMWRTVMLPDNGGKKGGYSGAAIWGSSPAIDQLRKLVYIATGNNYQVPDYVTVCEEQQRNRSKPNLPNPCANPKNHVESILALDLASGRIMWSTALGGFDAWTYICANNISAPNCPPILGPDYDFGEAPMLLTVEEQSKYGGMRDILVAGQKSGVVWAVDRDTGAVLWATPAGPGGYEGGATWGSATDGKKVFTNIANNENRTFTLEPSKAKTTAGGWVALDARNGAILWSAGNPDGKSPANGPVTIVNDVLLVGSNDPLGFVYALNAHTGKVLWNATTGSTVQGGFSVANGCAYIGTGYFYGIPGKLLYAFCLPSELLCA
ncbi:hypothetical protein O6H91_10G039700 [Diphasiastrum complanatum]|uniref:Uncharacterized protein n=1 Tax=Diphasiastrum complanatum TaxID=34168 RepID=A0ACC2CG49_DIPCM|nr:hypothetical protein O6H91_10G039700 [Diphasiastrum complanatum]